MYIRICIQDIRKGIFILITLKLKVYKKNIEKKNIE